jgi:general secretion pathway protein L
MADRILGLDISETAVRAVLATRTFKGGRRAVDAAEIFISETGGIPEALEKLFENPSFRGCPVVTAMPVEALSFRNLTLPFKNERKIRQIIPYELEPLLPFAIDECILDYVTVRPGASSDLFVTVALKTAIQQRTADLSGYVRKISRIDIEGAAVAAALPAKKPPTGCVLALDIGARHSVGLLMNNGRICQIRSFAFGGEQITLTIADTLKIDREDAERRKRENRPDGASESVTALVRKFMTELENTIEFMKLQGILPEGPERIFLTGGGALYPPLQDSLAHHFSVPVEPVNLVEGSDISVDQAFRHRWNPLIMNQALALAIAEDRRGLRFNLKIRDSRARAALGQIKGTLRWAAAVLAVFLILMGTDAYLDYSYNHQRLSRLRTEIAVLFKAYSPETTRVIDPVSQLKAGIAEARKISLGIGETRPDMIVLALLKDISTLAPPATELLLNTFTLEKDLILIKGQAKNFDAVDTLKKEYMKSKYFQAVTIGGTNLMKQGDKVEFDMRMTLKK